MTKGTRVARTRARTSKFELWLIFEGSGMASRRTTRIVMARRSGTFHWPSSVERVLETSKLAASLVTTRSVARAAIAADATVTDYPGTQRRARSALTRRWRGTGSREAIKSSVSAPIT